MFSSDRKFHTRRLYQRPTHAQLNVVCIPRICLYIIGFGRGLVPAVLPHRLPFSVDSPHKGPITQILGVSFDKSLNKQLNKKSRGKSIQMSWLSHHGIMVSGIGAVTHLPQRQ